MTRLDFMVKTDQYSKIEHILLEIAWNMYYIFFYSHFSDELHHTPINLEQGGALCS